MSGYGRIGLISMALATAAGAGVATLHAQTQLADPKDAPKIFASTCSACHKSPAGLAKSGQVAGFLRQHYTTGPEMSAAMAAYLVSAGSGPAGKKGQAEAKAKEQPGDTPVTKGKQKRQEASVQPADHPGEAKNAKESAKEAKETAREKRLLLRKQLEQAKAHEEHPGPHPSPASAAEAAGRQAPAPANAALTETPVAPATPAAPVAAAAPAPAPTPAPPPAGMPPVVTLDIPLPEMPTAPPADLTQSVFSSSPVP